MAYIEREVGGETQTGGGRRSSAKEEVVFFLTPPSPSPPLPPPHTQNEKGTPRPASMKPDAGGSTCILSQPAQLDLKAMKWQWAAHLTLTLYIQ